ncbi:SRPBCC family protein [Nocardioides pakistanensis]
MSIQRSYHIEAPVEKVFGFFSNPDEWKELGLMDVHDIHKTQDGVGTHFEWDMKVAGLRFHAFDVLTDVVPNKHITERSSVSMFGKWDYDFEPEGTGTKVTFTIQPQSFWRIPPLEKLVGMGIARMGETTVPRFRQKLEAVA